jgi:uncharacterized protein HemY
MLAIGAWSAWLSGSPVLLGFASLFIVSAEAAHWQHRRRRARSNEAQLHGASLRKCGPHRHGT